VDVRLRNRVPDVAIQGVPAVHRLGQAPLTHRSGMAGLPAVQRRRHAAPIRAAHLRLAARRTPKREQLNTYRRPA
jgi:hypothetical protein